MRLPLLLCLGIAAVSQALPDTIKDWHKPLAGIPITHTRSLAPRFHRRQEGRRTHSHIYVATEKNTIAALQPTYGTIGMFFIKFTCYTLSGLNIGPQYGGTSTTMLIGWFISALMGLVSWATIIPNPH